jgi:curved DNA-binding protein CbpA
MKHFQNISDLTSLRNEYKKLAKQFHPDLSGFDSTIIMQEINNEYDLIGSQLAKGSKFEESENELNKLYKEKIETLIKINNLFVEVIGNWIWVTGDTKEHKDLLKELKFRFAPVKKAWYFKTYSYKKKQGEYVDFEGMRQMFGSKKFANEENNNLSLIS